MDKVKALKEGVTQDVIANIVEDEGVTIDKAMEMLYNSEVFLKLSDNETGLYKESSAYVTGLLKEELANGKLVQTEI